MSCKSRASTAHRVNIAYPVVPPAHTHMHVYTRTLSSQNTKTSATENVPRMGSPPAILYAASKTRIIAMIPALRRYAGCIHPVGDDCE